MCRRPQPEKPGEVRLLEGGQRAIQGGQFSGLAWRGCERSCGSVYRPAEFNDSQNAWN